MNLLMAVACSVLIAASVAAAPIVNLKSVSPAGDRAIATYDKYWTEIDLSLDGGVEFLPAPQGCHWTSMSYAPLDGELAMIAFCPMPIESCEQSAALMLRKPPDGPALQVALRQGVRWSGGVWAAEAKRIHLVETRINQPVVMGLNDLNASVQRCGWAAPALKVVDVAAGAVISFDVLPSNWRPKAVISVQGDQVTATIGARTGVDDGSRAARSIAKACENGGAVGGLLRTVCKPSGHDLVMTWSDGEWALGAGEWVDGDAFPGRAIIAPIGNTLAREDCKVLLENGRYQLSCSITVARKGKTIVIDAPSGLFGDVALSGDGRFLVAVAAGRSERNRRFHIWNLDTGDSASLAPLLAPSAHFKGWPTR